MLESTVVKGVGLALVFANWVMIGWAIAWVRAPMSCPNASSLNQFQVFEAFLTSTILLGILTLLLLYSNVVLIVYHVPTWRRPLDIAFIHAPVRLFLILPLSLLFPYSLLYVVALFCTRQELNYRVPASLLAMVGTLHTHPQIKLTSISGRDSHISSRSILSAYS